VSPAEEVSHAIIDVGVNGRPLSRGFGPSICRAKPLVSYQINRQLSGQNPPPLVTRAFGAHQNEPRPMPAHQGRIGRARPFYFLARCAGFRAARGPHIDKMARALSCLFRTRVDLQVGLPGELHRFCDGADFMPLNVPIWVSSIGMLPA
jgi:hypothetical protein